ncbi:retropepsin-like aspartic protease [Hymenobacter cheonanensis]|uniref:retropepsin-like aspartic protease n=1 Tax=Hymenobacter sp. CA2-7 TaxID=3063993 RepID=UPI002713EC3B|nr:retropepsin-like aspartic protease [Hymenobacter sp. CA2-7]MDO7885985.1 retropepsin-like aspartic protease [Hymenobacter sp. CA2-7]
MPAPTLLLSLLSFLVLAAPSRAQPAVIRLPFDLVGGLVVLRNLPLNDQKGDFVLDTGCQYGLLLDQAAFSTHLQPAPTRGLSATGVVAQQQVRVRSFQLGSARYANLTAIATSLAPIRRAVPHLLGLVGYGVLREYEVVLDYAHRQLTCYPLSRPGPRPFTRRDSVAFTLEKGLPVVAGTIGQVPVWLLLDTGAMANNLDAAFSQRLPAPARPRVLGSEVMIGAAGRQAAQRALLPFLTVGGNDWHDLPVVLATLARPSSGRALPYQGVLGFSFLSQDVVVSFHYGRRQFYSLQPK